MEMPVQVQFKFINNKICLNGFPLHNCLHLQPHPQKPLHRPSTRTEYSNRLLWRPGVSVYQNLCEFLHNARFIFFTNILISVSLNNRLQLILTSPLPYMYHSVSFDHPFCS
jgi:hypothetical protein